MEPAARRRSSSLEHVVMALDRRTQTLEFVKSQTAKWKDVFVTLVEFEQLQSLTIRDCRLQDLGEFELLQPKQKKQLRSLNLSENSLSGGSISKIVDMFGRLVILKLNRNSYPLIEGAAAELLRRLVCLQVLEIDRSRIGNEGAHLICQLPRLTTLLLRTNLAEEEQNRIGDEGAFTMSRLTNLKSARLDNNMITDAGAEHIRKLASLTHLTISSNLLTLYSRLKFKNYRYPL